jgi:glycosyltransferase involved in cell wall biosynthesis
VNDGSTDNSLKILNEYSLKDSRIKIISKENGGQASARNIGIKEAHGEYIAFVDSDDFIEHTMFEKLYISSADQHKIPNFDAESEYKKLAPYREAFGLITGAEPEVLPEQAEEE